MSMSDAGPPAHLTQPRKLTHQEEIELTRRVVAGDDTAWDTLHHQFSQYVVGYFAGVTGRLSDAEDLAQNLLSEAYFQVRKDKYDSRYRFSTFLRVMARSVLSRYFRERKREVVFVPLPESLERLDPSEAGELDETRTAPMYEPTIPLPEFRMDIMNEMLNLVFLCCAKPHQIICFGFVKLLGWTPKRILSDLIDDQTVRRLGDRLCLDYFEESDPGCDFTSFKRTAFASFYEKLEKSCREIYAEPEYARITAQYGHGQVGDLPFDTFFTRPDRSASISEWCQNVKKRAQYMVRNGRRLCKAGL